MLKTKVKAGVAAVALLAVTGVNGVVMLPQANAWTNCWAWVSRGIGFAKCTGGTSSAYRVEATCKWGGWAGAGYTVYGKVARYDSSSVSCPYWWDSVSDAWVHHNL